MRDLVVLDNLRPNPSSMTRNITLSLVCSLLMVGAQAQITIGQNEMPHAGDELLRTRASIAGVNNYAATGAAHTWDFSNLQANGADTGAYQNVASTNFIYAIAFADVFFNPNRANHAKEGVDIAFNQLLPVQNPWTFFYGSSSAYKKVGYGVDLSGFPVPIIFGQADVVYELPLNFGNTSTSASSWNLNIPSIGYYGFQQLRENEVDGWGVVTTPGGTFDALRVKTTLTMADTLHFDTLGFGFAIDRPVVHEYKWLAQGLRVPVLQINTTTLFGFETVTDVFYYDVPRTLAVVAPLAATICPGAQVDVHYSTTGAFYAGGFFVPANVFTAQLSDGAGSFANPTNIGQVTATTSGVIGATIPPGTPAGSGYRIRVISSSPGFTGSDNGFGITIGGATTAEISASGPTLICTGDSVTLTAVGGPSYQWLADGSEIGGATDDVLIVTQAGEYSVVVDNTCGTATSTPITVTVNEPPTHEVDPLTYSTCAGIAVTIAAADLSGQSPLSYQWYLNNAPIVGATASSVDAMIAGAYTLGVTNDATGCSFLTAPAMLEVESVPVPVIATNGPANFCEGGSVQLSVGSRTGATYQWYQDGNAIGGAVDTMLTVGGSGDYSVVITSANGCDSPASAAAVITVFDLPATPVVVQANDSLLTIGTGPFQWYENGVAIVGANDPWLVPAENGDYTVEITDANGCSSMSDPYSFIGAGIGASNAVGVTLAPNPTSGTIVLSAPGSAGAAYRVTDASGRMITGGILMGDRTMIELAGQGSGVYFLHLNNARAVCVPFVVAR